MTVQGGINDELPFLRAEAEAMMQDTFTAYGLPEPTTVDGIDVEARSAVYDTPGRVTGRRRLPDGNTRMVSVGGTERPVVDGGLHIPLSAALPAIGWEFECIAVGPASDPALLGRRWRVIDVPAKSNATARRLDVVQVS